MPTIPWRTVAPPDADHTYIVMATQLPLRSHRTIPRFLRLTWAVARQLERTPGVIGYSLITQPIAKTFWTLSAWSDHDSLRAFVGTMPHLQVMKDLQGRMGTTRFTSWTEAGAALPASWTDAKTRLNGQGTPP